MKIDIQKIEFKNFFSYGNIWSEFSPNGISFITGNNTSTGRRNFTGKTNLLKVFPYALFGKIQGITKSRIINWKNRKQCETKITFKKGETLYTIHRGIKPDILKVYENGKEIPEASNKVDFQKQIEREILETDFDTFMNLVYADTNNSSSILQMSKPVKRAFLEQIFNLEYYTKLKDKANGSIASLQSKIHDSELNEDSINSQIIDCVNQIKKLINDRNDISDHTPYLKANKADLKNLTKSYTIALKSIKDLTIEKNDLVEKEMLNKTLMTKIEFKGKELKLKYCNVEESKVSMEDLIEKKRLLGKVRKLPHDVDKNDEIDVVNDYNKEILELETEIKFKENRMDDIEKEINSKSSVSTCPTCFQRVDKKKVEDHFIKELSRLGIDILNRQKILSSNLKGLDVVLKRQDQRKENERVEKENEKIENQLILVLTEIVEKEKNFELLRISYKFKKVLDKLRKKYNTIKSVSLSNDLKSIETSIKGFESEIIEYENIERIINDVKLKIESEAKERLLHDKWIKENESKVKKFKKKIIKMKNEVDKFKNLKDYFLVVKEICGDREARQYTLSTKIPYLNQRVNYYLSQCDVGFFVKLDNWLECEIKGPGISNAVYSNLSGAERVAIDRSLQFAMNDIVKLSSPSYFNLLILDEILDSSVDVQGLKNLTQIIKAKKENDELNILVVSHKTSMESISDDFIDNSYVAEFSGGYSKIKEI